MKSIYLDSSHLIDWLESKWPSNAAEEFESLVATREFRFILSSIHLDEVSDVPERSRLGVFETFRRILSFPHSWIIGPRNLHEREIATALGLAIVGDNTSQGAFAISEITADSWAKVVQIDDPAWAARFANMSNENLIRDFILNRRAHETRALKVRAQSDVAVIKSLGKLDRTRLFRALRTKDEKYINRLMPKETTSGIFVPSMLRTRVLHQLCDNQCLSIAAGLGVFLNLRNEIMSNEQKPGQGDTWDFSHATFLPYLDLFSCDKRTKNYILSIRKRLQRKWPSRVHSVPVVSNLDELLAAMKGMVAGANCRPPSQHPDLRADDP